MAQRIVNPQRPPLIFRVIRSPLDNVEANYRWSLQLIFKINQIVSKINSHVSGILRKKEVKLGSGIGLLPRKSPGIATFTVIGRHVVAMDQRKSYPLHVAFRAASQ